MVLELFRYKRLSFERYRDAHGRDRRSFQRDLQQLREIGKTSGFSISPLKSGSYVELEKYDARIRTLHREGSKSEQLIGDVARAMGQPIAAEIGPLGTTPASADERFFHFATPTIIEDGDSRVSKICAALKAAWESKAVVEFQYPDIRGSGASVKRLVEPYRVLLRSGVFYLVGYDRGRRDWRTFALDRFTSIPVRNGSNNIVRTIPASYASDDVLGFIKSNEPRTEVTVELSSRVAASATSRRWQAEQRIEFLDGQRARITFAVSDLSEVVRWAFGFGDDAQIIGPAEAVRIAGQMARSIAARYEQP
jgi:predicted DNA-binding transcriptional regulator YafY